MHASNEDMGGSQTLCALRKCDAANTEEGKRELEVLRKNVHHLVVEGTEYAIWSLIWVQAFEKLRTLVLPQRPFMWQNQDEIGVNRRIAERLLRVWRSMKKGRCSIGKVDVVHKAKGRWSYWDAFIGEPEPELRGVVDGPPRIMFLDKREIEERFGDCELRSSAQVGSETRLIS
jgi:hypothetical protein